MNKKNFKITIIIACLALNYSAKSEEIVSSESLIKQWVKTERLLVTERLDWEEKKNHTRQITQLYEKELILLNEELSKAGNNALLVDQDAQTLKQSIKDSEKARLLAIRYLKKLTPRVISLINKLPDILQQQLTSEKFILQNDVNNATVQDSLRATIKILQESARFDRNFVFEEYPINLNGEMLRAKVMYLGLSCAFFRAGETFGKAVPTDTGWVFTEDPTLAKEIIKAFAIKSKVLPSSFFELPLKLGKEQL